MNKTTTHGNTEGIARETVGKVAHGSHAMIGTSDAIATSVGLDVLKSGGNAIDALVASAFALAVTYPEAGNIGGGGFVVVRMTNGKTMALDFRETAPATATRDMYVDAQGKVTEQSLTGHLASGVPGSVAGLWELHRTAGSRPWGTLLQPAIALARDGFIVDEHLSRTLANDERLARFPESARVFLPDGKAPAPGSRLRNPDLAATLQRIADRGRDGFYKGETAELIAQEMKRGGGLITQADLAAYQPKWREPLQFTYRDHTIIAMPPASSGGVTLALMLNILEGYDLRALDPRSAQRYHLLAEASRRAFADRNYYLGDPDFVQMPLATLLSKPYAAQNRATIQAKRATPSTEIRPAPRAMEGSETTHISIVDADGSAVAFTTTINELHGSAVTVSGAGFLLNDEMDDFTARPGTPNQFGLVQGEANTIAPGKRMLSAMTPTIVVDPNGQTLLVTGARGGPRIISFVMQVVSNVIDHGMSLPQAVLEPRIHHQHLPDVLHFEKDGLSSEVQETLRSYGHTVEARGAIGSGPAILRRGKEWLGFADPRSSGSVVGY